LLAVFWCIIGLELLDSGYLLAVFWCIIGLELLDSGYLLAVFWCIIGYTPSPTQGLSISTNIGMLDPLGYWYHLLQVDGGMALIIGPAGPFFLLVNFNPRRIYDLQTSAPAV
jgi:hypothetical protein